MVDICVDVCVDVGVGMCVDMRVDMLYVEMRLVIRVDHCIYTRVDMCVAHVYTRVCRHGCRRPRRKRNYC